MAERFTGWSRGSYYRPRWQWWAPWDVVHPWLPRLFTGSDEFCNPSVGVVLPFLGCLVIFYARGPMRTTQCDECIALDGTRLL
jgi:hypothetical protein